MPDGVLKLEIWAASGTVKWGDNLSPSGLFGCSLHQCGDGRRETGTFPPSPSSGLELGHQLWFKLSAPGCRLSEFK
jgi:hypothetical protein